ncbi:GNAT family N-acetyltransferase [Rhizobium laguerreae]|uniref:GNAT family N-acetyltransferase n=1 Tax=Rhizobium laguerreae TaxID=1076926 RepID=UPI001C90AE17|nr:GNAT family N-acetyltransferase [Rhizobium laguerreae]MBY3469243.1 GNAT family N-acetyltransferase [Rhizobium laguerreae]
MNIRTAIWDDAAAMSVMLQRLVALGKRSAKADVEYVQHNYVANPVGIRCSLAEDEGGRLLGFQSLIRATEGNRYGTPIGWGIIGTHVSPDAARLGVGRRLFNVTRQAAIDAGVTKIEALIGLDNAAAQAFYESAPSTGRSAFWAQGTSIGHQHDNRPRSHERIQFDDSVREFYG